MFSSQRLSTTIPRPRRSNNSTSPGYKLIMSCSTLPHMPISAVCRRVASCEILSSYTTMVACVDTCAQSLILFSCTYISLTVIAHQGGQHVQKSTHVTVNKGVYHSAFTVLDAAKFETVVLFQTALRVCLDKVRERLAIGDCADNVVCRDFLRRNPHNAYPAPVPVSQP